MHIASIRTPTSVSRLVARRLWRTRRDDDGDRRRDGVVIIVVIIDKLLPVHVPPSISFSTIFRIIVDAKR